MTILDPHQIEGCRQIYKWRGRVLLADEMGLGKTIQALYWILKTPSHRPALIVCPASMKWTWQAEAAMHFNMRTEVLEGFYKKRTKHLPGKIIILNYELLHSWWKFLKSFDPQTIVFDEIHFIKTPTAKRTVAATHLAKDVPSILGLSGTPLLNRPIELWPSISIIRPDLFKSFQKYAWRYCKPKYTPWGWQYNGATHKKELHAILKDNLMVRRLKSDVNINLPPMTHRMIRFKLSSQSSREYKNAQEDFIGWLRKISPSRAIRASKSKALTKIGYLLRLVARLKLDLNTKWISDFFESHPGEKLVAMTMHTKVIDHLHEKFKGSVIIDGRVTGRKRHETVKLFQNNPRCQLLLGNWRAAGVGITLHAARFFAALDFPWTPGELEQGIARIHRRGQKRKVIMHYLAVLGTIEEKLIKVLQEKSTVLNAILDGKGSSKDLDIFEELLNEIQTLVE